MLALPLGFERTGIVHHIAQPEDERRAARPQQVERGPHLAVQPERFLVDDQDVGIEDVGGMADDRGAHRQRFLDVDMEVERDILAVAQLDYAGNPHKIHTRTKIEAADDRRSR
jgi:hypothetical protein